jgi:hypothetical protein
MNKMYLNYYYIGHGIYLDIKIILFIYFIIFNFNFFVKILLVFIINIHNIIEF